MGMDFGETLELLDRARHGDASAFEELFRHHRVQLQKAIAMRLDRNPEILDTLAAAQYRMGKYADVVKTTAISCERRGEPSIPSTTFLAMAQFKLGDIAKARASLGELQKIIKQQRVSKSSLLEEAESLLGSH
ncbi:MAG: hypothetical protein JXA73_07705 [Acidobacteria bacterium]|nr:hypothetical protein [Acidobacteriota bacterium]